MAYTGPFQVRVTARCVCKAITVGELDYEMEKDEVGKTVAEIIPEIACKACAKIAFKRSRFGLADLSEAVAEEKHA